MNYLGFLFSLKLMKLNNLTTAKRLGGIFSENKIPYLFIIFFIFSYFQIENSYCFSNLEVNNNKENSNFSDEQRIFELINDERIKKGLEPLNWNSKLAEMARDFSQKMAKERFFDHFDRDRKSVVDRAKDKKVKNWRRLGENLFMGDVYDNIAKIAVRGWMRSSSHRSNILDANYEETGIGISYTRDGKIYITQVFMQNL